MPAPEQRTGAEKKRGEGVIDDGMDMGTDHLRQTAGKDGRTFAQQWHGSDSSAMRDACSRGDVGR
jgi:hypothetical protein